MISFWCAAVLVALTVSSPLPFSSSPERESQTTINADDSIQSRLAKLETQNKQQAERLLRVEEENLRLTASMAEQQRRQFRLEAENSRLNVLMKLLQERTPESHQEQGVLLSEEEENLNKSVQSPQDPAKQQISFHAQLSNGFSTHFHDQDVVNMTYIWTNQGHAYNGTVGYFRAPISGTYFFIATAVTSRGPNRAAVVMWVNIRPVCFTDGWTSAREGDSSTCTAVVHVKTGQAVWLESIGEADFWYGSSFSGFLVSSDE